MNHLEVLKEVLKDWKHNDQEIKKQQYYDGLDKPIEALTWAIEQIESLPTREEIVTIIDRYVLSHKFEMTGLKEIRSLADKLYKRIGGK